MKTIEIYRNYGCLAAEKRNVYTSGNSHATAAAWDKITIEIPAGYEAFENEFGETIIEAPWGMTYTVNELLAGDEKPMFRAYDADQKLHQVALKVIEG